MTARHILSRWERMRAVVRKGKSRNLPFWIAALHVADFVEVTAHDLCKAIGCYHSQADAYINVMVASRMLDPVGWRSRTHKRQGRVPKLYRATPKLYEVLGVEPQSSTTEAAA
ncbi:MAG: hypothetical protein ACO1TE_29280 [Prosthecobacter sp.]